MPFFINIYDICKKERSKSLPLEGKVAAKLTDEVENDTV